MKCGECAKWVGDRNIAPVYGECPYIVGLVHCDHPACLHGKPREPKQPAPESDEQASVLEEVGEYEE